MRCDIAALALETMYRPGCEGAYGSSANMQRDAIGLSNNTYSLSLFTNSSLLTGEEPQCKEIVNFFLM
jgi:hypothetical protein